MEAVSTFLTAWTRNQLEPNQVSDRFQHLLKKINQGEITPEKAAQEFFQIVQDANESYGLSIPAMGIEMTQLEMIAQDHLKLFSFFLKEHLKNDASPLKEDDELLKRAENLLTNLQEELISPEEAMNRLNQLITETNMLLPRSNAYPKLEASLLSL